MAKINRRAQASGLTWFAAIIVLFVIMLIFISSAIFISLNQQASKNKNEINSVGGAGESLFLNNLLISFLNSPAEFDGRKMQMKYFIIDAADSSSPEKTAYWKKKAGEFIEKNFPVRGNYTDSSKYSWVWLRIYEKNEVISGHETGMKYKDFAINKEGIKDTGVQDYCNPNDINAVQKWYGNKIHPTMFAYLFLSPNKRAAICIQEYHD